MRNYGFKSGLLVYCKDWGFVFGVIVHRWLPTEEHVRDNQVIQ